MRNIKIILMIVLISIVLYLGYRAASFQLFDTNFIELESIEIPNKDYNIQLYLIPSNASSQNYIQVRKIKHNVVDVIANYERYNQVDGYSVSDTLLQLILRENAHRKADTLSIELP